MRDMLARRCFAVIGSILSETMLVYTSGVQILDPSSTEVETRLTEVETRLMEVETRLWKLRLDSGS